MEPRKKELDDCESNQTQRRDPNSKFVGTGRHNNCELRILSYHSNRVI